MSAHGGIDKSTVVYIRRSYDAPERVGYTPVRNRDRLGTKSNTSVKSAQPLYAIAFEPLQIFCKSFAEYLLELVYAPISHETIRIGAVRRKRRKV